MKHPVYLDYAATTPLDARVLASMQPYLTAVYGNPSSLHCFGQAARRAVMRAREQTAALIGASPAEVFFTSGGTESDNWALRSLAEGRRKKGCRHIVTSAVEHPAVRETCRDLAAHGYTLTELPVDAEGRITLSDVEAALQTDTALVSIMTANNEVGTIEPIAEIGALVRAHGILFHTDAVQAAGHIPLNVNALNVDALSFSAHKFCGPKGIGILYVRRGTAIAPLLYGGAQERDMRAGTENTAAIVGCGCAAEIAGIEMTAENERLKRCCRVPAHEAVCGRRHFFSRGQGVASRGHFELRHFRNVTGYDADPTRFGRICRIGRKCMQRRGRTSVSCPAGDGSFGAGDTCVDPREPWTLYETRGYCFFCRPHYRDCGGAVLKKFVFV